MEEEGEEEKEKTAYLPCAANMLLTFTRCRSEAPLVAARLHTEEEHEEMEEEEEEGVAGGAPVENHAHARRQELTHPRLTACSRLPTTKHARAQTHAQRAAASVRSDRRNAHTHVRRTAGWVGG